MGIKVLDFKMSDRQLEPDDSTAYSCEIVPDLYGPAQTFSQVSIGAQVNFIGGTAKDNEGWIVTAKNPNGDKPTGPNGGWLVSGDITTKGVMPRNYQITWILTYTQSLQIGTGLTVVPD